MSENIEEHIIFKQILNTLEESIVIASKTELLETNDCFLKEFGDLIDVEKNAQMAKVITP
jgi:hypothetical protein